MAIAEYTVARRIIDGVLVIENTKISDWKSL